MTPTVATVPRTLDLAAIKALAADKGPCITMFIPDHHPGAQAGSRATLVRDMLHRAEMLLQGNKKLRAHAADLLAPLSAIAESEEIQAGGPGFVIFRAPNNLDLFQLPGTTSGKLALSSHFALHPLLERVYAPQRFHILAISRKHLKLFRYRSGACEEVPLPPKVPVSVEVAGAFDPPDHDLENRSTAGASTGSMKAVHFGTLSDRETAPQYLYNFLGIVDHGLKETLNNEPLLLAGVHEETAAYRRASGYPRILQTEIDGNIEFLPMEQVASRAANAAREHFLQAGQRVLAELREMTDRSRTLAADPRAILRAAAAGRVHQLCVREGAEVQGHMEKELDTIHAAHEDLINAAAVETIRYGGEVFVLPPDQLPASSPLAAVLRF